MFRTLLIIVLLLITTHASEIKHDPDFIKSVYIEKISRFLTWPDYKEKSDEFHLCTTSDTSMEKYLFRVYGYRKIKNKRTIVTKITDLDEAKKCHILHINSSNVDQALFLKEYAVLLIGSSDGLEQKSIHFNFFDEGERVRFWVNPKAYKNFDVKVNHQLFSIAKIVK